MRGRGGFGREGRRYRREAARALAKEILNSSSDESHWGFVFTYWGTLVGWIGLGIALPQYLIVSLTFFGIALLQLLLGVWLWVKNKSRPWRVLVSIFVLTMFLGVGYTWISAHRKLTISPLYLSFPGKQPGDSFTITVRNNTDENLYEIAFKLRIEPDSMAAENFTVSFPEGTRRYIGTATKVGDIVGFLCRTPERHPFLFMSIYRLMPHESRDLILTRTKGIPSIVRAEVSSFQSSPAAYRERSKWTYSPYPTDPETTGCYGFDPFPAKMLNGEDLYEPMPYGTTK